MSAGRNKNSKRAIRKGQLKKKAIKKSIAYIEKIGRRKKKKLLFKTGGNF